MLVKISKKEAINPFWVISVHQSNSDINKATVVLGNPGRAGVNNYVNYFLTSDYSVDETIKLINKGMK